jgi:hypothetical protein
VGATLHRVRGETRPKSQRSGRHKDDIIQTCSPRVFTRQRVQEAGARRDPLQGMCADARGYAAGSDPDLQV